MERGYVFGMGNFGSSHGSNSELAWLDMGWSWRWDF